MTPDSISPLDELVAVLMTTDPLKRNIERALDNVTRTEAGGAGTATEAIEALLWQYGRIREASDSLVKMLATHLITERGMSTRQVGKAVGVAHTTVERWAKRP